MKRIRERVGVSLKRKRGERKKAACTVKKSIHNKLCFCCSVTDSHGNFNYILLQEDELSH